MAKTDTFHCAVITPERKMLETDATFVAFPAHDGEMGVLRNRAPLICKLGIGTLRVEAPDGTHRFFIDEGFVQVADNSLTILTEQARRAEDIDRGAAEEALARAREMKVTDDDSRVAREKAVRRAKAQLDLAAAAAGPSASAA